MALTNLVSGADVILKNMRKYEGAWITGSLMACRAAGEYFKEELKTDISLRCHSLQDLADMGHPYARNWLAKRGIQGKARASSSFGKASLDIGPSVSYSRGSKSRKIPMSQRKIRARGGGAHGGSDYQVHTQTGAMVGSLFVDTHAGPTVSGVTVGLKPNPPQNVWVVFGTSKMIPRPVVWASFGKNYQKVRAVFIKELRSVHATACTNFTARGF